MSTRKPEGLSWQSWVDVQVSAARERGEFDNLPGEGQPLQLDDDSAIPEELRVAYRILKNAGCLPPEQALRNEVTHVENLLLHVEDSGERRSLTNRLTLLKTRLEMQGGESNLLLQEAVYRDKIARRLSA